MDFATPIEKLDLSVRSINGLKRAGIFTLGEIMDCDEDRLMSIRNLGAKSVNEILQLQKEYARSVNETILQKGDQKVKVFDVQAKGSCTDDLRDATLLFAQVNDIMLEKMNLSGNAYGCLKREGYEKLSQILFLSKESLSRIFGIREKAVNEIDSFVNSWKEQHRENIQKFHDGDDSVLLDDQSRRKTILAQYQALDFGGLSLDEMSLQSGIPADHLKKVIGSLLAEGTLEYVDYRCYRVYPKISTAVKNCPQLKDRNRSIVERRLNGETLEAIAQDYDLTRERIRQIVKNNIDIVRKWSSNVNGAELFDEEYYRYFYETYAFDKKDAEQWFGITPAVFQFLTLIDAKQGEDSLNQALEDSKLDAGLRLKIKTYLNRDRLFVDGIWIEKRRAELELIVLKKYCRDTVSFAEFCALYNSFLEQQDIPYDEDIYLTEAVRTTRRNRLSEDKSCVLWKQNEQLRYYDIDGHDYTELLDTLELDSYENTEISTQKFIENYPELMEKYDIRDCYELHNLLRKIIPENKYHDLRFSKMPMLRFGIFDRDLAIMNLIRANSPITAGDLCRLLHQEYGYDIATIQGSYLPPFSDYNHMGTFRVDTKPMPLERQRMLKDALTEDFYYMDELHALYTQLFPQADPEELNVYSLKSMGFLVLSNYVLQNHPSLEQYFEELLTSQDVIDITQLRARFSRVVMFSQKLLELKRYLTVIEYEPNKLLNFRQLARKGIRQEDIRHFCQEVYEFAESGTFFSIHALREDGFVSDLFYLGYTDYFYGNLLLSDGRFSFGRVFNCLIFCKDKSDITIRSFLEQYIHAVGSIDVCDLMETLNRTYGCQINDRSDLIYKLRGGEVYYDQIQDRLYANSDLFYRELEESREGWQ